MTKRESITTQTKEQVVAIRKLIEKVGRAVLGTISLPVEGHGDNPKTLWMQKIIGVKALTPDDVIIEVEALR